MTHILKYDNDSGIIDIATDLPISCIESVLEQFLGMANTEDTRTRIQMALEEYIRCNVPDKWYAPAGIKRGQIDTWIYGSMLTLYITKENIDGEELLILSGERLVTGDVMTVQEEFSSLWRLVNWVTDNKQFEERTILLRYRAEEATEEDLKSRISYSEFWELSDCEEYYELKLYPK